MAKFFGLIGYATTEQTSPGVFEERIIELPYRGDVLKNHQKWQKSEYLNDNFEVVNSISILSDVFALENIGKIKYVCWLNSKWKVNSIDIQYPRIVLHIGGVYNESV